MAVVRLVLGDKNEVWLLVQFLQGRDARLRLLFGDGEDGAEDSGGAGEPRIEENGKRARKEAGRGHGRHGRGEGEQESGVTVEGLHRQGHGGSRTARSKKSRDEDMRSEAEGGEESVYQGAVRGCEAAALSIHEGSASRQDAPPVRQGNRTRGSSRSSGVCKRAAGGRGLMEI